MAGRPRGESVPVPPESAIRDQLERLLASAHFAKAPVATRLLRFIVGEALAGRAEALKETSIAIEVFGRDVSYDPKADPTVRVEASRLRQRLEHYYLTEGRADPLLIELPRGGYRPAFAFNADALHLREDLSAAPPSRTRDAAQVPLIRGPWIAVLPFENLGEAADAVFADGISTEILTALARFRELHVIGRHSVTRHRFERDATRLHVDLGADYVVAGDARRAEQRLRVHVRLLDATQGDVMWSEGFDRDLSTTAIFDVQDEITARVVATIAKPHGLIARPELLRVRRNRPRSLRAYECLLLYYDYAENRCAATHARIRDDVDSCLREESGTALLWSLSSFLLTETARFGFNLGQDRDRVKHEARRTARRAVKLDPNDALGYNALFLAHFALGDLQAFRRAGDRAVTLNPNNSDILADFGLHLTMCEEWTLGRLLLKAALALDPEPPDWVWFPLFDLHFQNGEYDAALDAALRSQNEQFFWTHAMHGMAYEALGMRAQAAAAIERLLALYPSFPRVAREELSHWLRPHRVAPALEALYRAGLPSADALA